MINVLAALFHCNLFPPELLNSVDELLFGLGLDSGLQIIFQLMPEVLYGVEIGALWESAPPVDSLLLHKSFGSL